MTPINRRIAIAGLSAIGLALLTGCAQGDAPEAKPQDNGGDDALRKALADIEARSGGRLGAAVLDCKDGMLTGHRLDERFTMCSTFKLSLVALILTRIDAEEIALDARLPITAADPVGHAPVVQARLDAGETSMTVLDLCEAAQTQSDNGAANILLRKAGGPQALTAFWRALGDTVSRLDRYEPDLNTSHDGDPRDTTSAGAMAKSMRAMLTGTLLRPARRERLIAWSVATQTGLKRLRGGLPAGWRAGDKTGSYAGDGSSAAKINDIAICWLPSRTDPFIITAFLESTVTGTDTIRPEDEAVLAEVGRAAHLWIESRV